MRNPYDINIQVIRQKVKIERLDQLNKHAAILCYFIHLSIFG